METDQGEMVPRLFVEHYRDTAAVITNTKVK